MKKILYLHGFASSGASGTVALLRREYFDRRTKDKAAVIAPDIPVDPAEALPMLKALAEKENPDLVIGTSMGALYAHQLHGFTRICINPCFALSKCYSILSVGRHKWLNERRDGSRDFQVTKEIVTHFAEMESRQFEGIDEADAMRCFGLFGDADPIGKANRPIFSAHYPGMDHSFAGGHRMNADLVAKVLFPFVKSHIPQF